VGEDVGQLRPCRRANRECEPAVQLLDGDVVVREVDAERLDDVLARSLELAAADGKGHEPQCTSGGDSLHELPELRSRYSAFCSGLTNFVFGSGFSVGQRMTPNRKRGW